MTDFCSLSIENKIYIYSFGRHYSVSECDLIHFTNQLLVCVQILPPALCLMEHDHCYLSTNVTVRTRQQLDQTT